MGISIKNVNVDFDKLRAELFKRGLTITQASTQMGRSSSYFSGMKSKGYLPESTLIMLDSMWNIKYEDIAPVEPPKAGEPKSSVDSEMLTISKDELRFIITESIKDAFVWYANR